MAKRRVERRKSVGKNRADFGMKTGSEEGRERKSKREKQDGRKNSGQRKASNRYKEFLS